MRVLFCSGVIITNKSEVVITQSPSGKLMQGFWEFPGGKVEKGETRQECLQRELLEELSVEAIAGEEIAESEYHYDHGSFLIIAIEVTLVSTDIVLKDHDKMEWVEFADLKNYKLGSSTLRLFSRGIH